MIRNWLVRKTGIEPLATRIDTLERELRDMGAMLAVLGKHIGAVERLATDATDALAASARRTAALQRAMRVGTGQLRRALAAIGDDTIRAETIADEMARLQGAMTILDGRIHDEAEQARRAAAGLFARIEAVRR